MSAEDPFRIAKNITHFRKETQEAVQLVPGNLVKGIAYYGAETVCMYVGFRKGEHSEKNAVAGISALAFVSTTQLLPIYDKWPYPVPNPSGSKFPFTLKETRFYKLPNLPYTRFDDLNEIEILDATPLAKRTDLF
jgi:hypothetical protein